MRRLVIAALTLALVSVACSNAEEPVNEVLIAGGATLEQGVTYRYAFFIHCGMEWMEEFNGTKWRTDEPIYRGAGRPPDSLRQFFVNPNETISPDLWTHLKLVAPDEILLTLPDGSQDSIYYPTDDEWPGCA